jgi:4-amino-4-deoxy-L-arabinose transferase-like glycosyltransferase
MSSAAAREARREKPAPASASRAGAGVPWKWIAAITLVAAALRFIRLGTSPPGLNQDEAINAWNAWCLLKTGHDMTGAAWPVFYSHAIGDNRTTLFFYLLMPFQALFGLSAWSTRLPAAFFGALAVPLIGYVAARWWGRGAGIVAAVLLAIDPWHLFMSRWGIEGSVTPFLALLPLALLTAAGLLPGSVGVREDTRAGAAASPARAAAPLAPAGSFRWPLALAAGLAAGIATYGYWSMRLFIPAWLIATALLMGPAAWREWRRGPALRTWLAFLAGLAITFGPLVWRHIVDPAIAQRAVMTRLWEPGASVIEIARLVAGRWVIHYGPQFLFMRGDTYELLQPAVDGAMHRFMLPLFLIGIVAAIARFRRDPASRALLALVAVYPAGDLLAAYDGVHSLRSAAGIGALVLLAAFGAVAAWDWLALRGRWVARAAAVGFAAVALVFTVRSMAAFYGEYNQRSDIYKRFFTELTGAARWMKPRFEGADAVFCTTSYLNQAWAILLVELGYDPRRWFREPRERIQAGQWDEYRRVGRIVFMHDPSAQRDADALEANGKPDRVYFIVRPGQLGLKDPLVVFRRGAEELLWVCEVTL